MTIEEFAAAYPVYVEAECREGQYEITGTQRLETASLVSMGGESVEIRETGLKGWGYDVFAVVNISGGFTIAIMAKAAQSTPPGSS